MYLFSPSASSASASTHPRRSRPHTRSHARHVLSSCALAAASLATVAVFAATSARAQSTYTVSITPPAQAASASPVSEVLSQSFVGFGIEPTSLFEFAGGPQRNNLTYNLLNNMANYTGMPPHLRIGGNAGDQQTYSATTTGYESVVNYGASASQSNAYLFGPNYFKVFNFFPNNTPITYQLNLAYQGSGWQTTIVNTAKAVLAAATSVDIVSFEIGNEPDLYVENGYRSSSNWSAANFALQWQDVAVEVYNSVLQPLGIGTDFFEPACTATTATNNGHPYRISELVDSAIALDDGVYIAGWNQHDYFYYVGVSTYSITIPLLLDLSGTESQFTEWKSQSAQAYATGKKYYLREMNSIGPTGLESISSTFAQTLWVFNFHLYAATLLVAAVHMHLTTYSWGSPWLPIVNGTTQPYVRSSYYAYAAIAQIIGATCDAQIASLSLSNPPSGYSDYLRVYQKYQGGVLQSLIGVNTMPAYSGSSMNTVNFVYSVPSWAGKTVYVSYLSASGVDATSNTTWNGLSYEVTGTGLSSPVSSAAAVTMTVGSSGVLTVPLRDSEAFVANVNYQIGTTNAIVNATNCGIASAASATSSTVAATFSSARSNPFDAAQVNIPDMRILLVLSLAVLAGSMAVLL